MEIHVLPGDALAETFKNSNFEGEIVVCRECLIDGDVKAENLATFWDLRAKFIANSYGEADEKYFTGVVSEFDRLINLSNKAEVNLWFGNELFCQINMWFCLYLLRNTGAKIYFVAPVVSDEKDIWKCFGRWENEDLQKCFSKRIEFTEDDKNLGANLWQAYQNSDYEMLEKLSETNSKCFPHLKEVCRAEIEKEVRPLTILRKIIAAGANDFSEIFPEFSNLAGIYGFGDSQVKRILQKI